MATKESDMKRAWMKKWQVFLFYSRDGALEIFAFTIDREFIPMAIKMKLIM